MPYLKQCKSAFLHKKKNRNSEIKKIRFYPKNKNNHPFSLHPIYKICKSVFPGVSIFRTGDKKSSLFFILI